MSQGNKKSKNNARGQGRPKGSHNKDKQWVQDIAARYNLHPFEVLMAVANNDYETLGYESNEVIKMAKDGVPYTEERISLDQRISAASSAANFMLPRLKAIEVSGNVDINIDERKKTVDHLVKLHSKGRLKIEPPSSNS